MAMEQQMSLKDSLKEKLERAFTQPVDPDLESRVVSWIEEMTGENRGTIPTANWLKNGKILCTLLNRIQPNAVKIRRSLVPTDKMENIQKFIGVVKGLGVPVFDPFDLYDGTDMEKVLRCVEALRGLGKQELPLVSSKPSDMGHQLSINVPAAEVHDTNAPDDNAGASDQPKFLPSTGNFGGGVSPRGGIIRTTRGIPQQTQAKQEPEPQAQAKQVDPAAAPPLQQGSLSVDGSKPRVVQDNEAGNCCASCVLQ